MRRALFWSVVLVALAALLPLVGATVLRSASLLREVQGRLSHAPKEGQFIAGDDVQLFMMEAGPAFGTPVVLVPGPGGWSGLWRPTMEALADAGYHVIALDLPPFGYSFRPASGDYSTESQARRLAAALDALGLARAAFVAHSVSARTVVEFVMHQPDRASALVLVAPQLGLQEPPGASANVATHALLDYGVVRNAVVASTLSNPWVTEQLVRRVTRRSEAVTPERIALLQQPLHLTGTTDAIGRWLEHFVLSEESPASRQPLRYKDLQMPTLLIWGTDDPVAPLSQGQHLASLLPASVLSTMPGVGHWPPLEDERAFNAQLVDALAVMAPTLPAAARDADER